ncbi:MAG: hypothetical protein ACYCV5_00065 [Acidimicrobiales bacterium]|jgi:hypothetical protein
MVAALGIWRPERPVPELTTAVVGEALQAVADVGVVEAAAARWPARAAEEAVAVAHWLASVLQEIVATPAPAAELPKLAALFGPAGLAELLGVAPRALDRYLGGAQAVPDDVAHGAHLIAQIAGALAGSYND